MNNSRNRLVLSIGVAGLLFAGYLSGTKLLTETCAFNESCPYFLGFPACYFGFVMYAVITVYATLRVLRKIDSTKANSVILFTAALGILFSGYFTFGELPLLFSKGISAYFLGLPTCALGLIFYIIIFFLSFKNSPSTTA